LIRENKEEEKNISQAVIAAEDKGYCKVPSHN